MQDINIWLHINQLIWVYNFKTPVNISAVEIFSIKDANSFQFSGKRLNNLNFSLFNTSILANTTLTPSNFTNNTTNLIGSGSFGQVNNTSSDLLYYDLIHKVFVVDSSLISSLYQPPTAGSDNNNIFNPINGYNSIISITPQIYPLKYISGVKSLVIVNPNDYVVLSGVFMYDDKGNLIENIPENTLQS